MISDHSNFIAQAIDAQKTEFGLVSVYDNLIEEFADTLPLFAVDVDKSLSLAPNVMDERYLLTGLAIYTLEDDLAAQRLSAIQNCEKIRKYIESIRLDARTKYDVEVEFGYNNLGGVNVMTAQYEITIYTN